MLSSLDVAIPTLHDLRKMLNTGSVNLLPLGSDGGGIMEACTGAIYRLPDVARHPLLEKIAIPLLNVIGVGALGRMYVIFFGNGGRILFRGALASA